MRIIANGRPHSSGRALTIGRDRDNDIVVDHDKVSRHHARLHEEDGVWIFEDSSTNGSFMDGSRVERVRIDQPRRLLLGSVNDGAALTLELEAEPEAKPEPAAVQVPDGAATQAMSPPDEEPPGAATRLGSLTMVHRATSDRISIGRDRGNDVVLADDVLVSRRHAELTRYDGHHQLADLDSHNGTFVNGERIDRRALAEMDVVTIGNTIFLYRGGALEEYQDSGSAWLESAGLVVRTPEGRTILNGIGFALQPSSLLAIVGPSGAGKSTLLNALTGFRPADDGVVTYGGRDVYASFDDLRLRMGYVPQDDILHPQLTVRKALSYAAELRFPPDVDRSMRTQRVNEVMDELGLGERADLPIERLSGGQRKRVSIGIELLTRPSLLFLDEPTSGLDPGNEAAVMDLLRSLADGGRIVIVVTHSVQSLEACDRVAYVAPGGTLAFFGPPSAALGYFKRFDLHTHATIFRALDEQRDREWNAAFTADSTFEQYVRKASTLSAVRRARRGEQPLPPQPTLSWFRQLSVLVRRYVSVIRADRKTLILLAAQAPVFGILDFLLLQKGTLSTRMGVQASMLVWLIAIGATWLGLGSAIREIAKESAIYRRERSVGLSISAYVASKVVVLGAITIIQSLTVALLALAKQTIPPQDPIGVFKILGKPVPVAGSALGSMWLELLLVFSLAGLAAMSVGLLISSISKTVDRALTLLPLLLIAHIIASMPNIPQKGALQYVGYAMTSKYANDAAASTVSMNELRLPYYAAVYAGSTIIFGTQQTKRQALKPFRPEWEHTPKAWLTDVAGVAAWFLFGIGGTLFVLWRRDRNILGGASARAKKKT